MSKVHVYTTEEATILRLLQDEFRSNVAHMSSDLYNKEMERLAIDLS